MIVYRKSTRTLLLVAALALSGVARGADSPNVAAGDDFTNDIVPVLTKLGCNGGGCHGKATGRGGFKLSLWGQNPAADFDAITRGSRGRRVFPAAPEQSLLLRKATMTIPHGGGRRLSPEDPEYILMREWIGSSLPWGKADAPRVVALRLTPATLRASRNAQQAMKAIAVYSDNTTRDVTRLTRFKSNDSSLATVSDNGETTIQNRTGATSLVGQYQGQVAVSHILVPRTVTPAEAARFERFPIANPIDRHVVTKLQQLGIPPAAAATDATFLRRVTQQLAGRLPTLAETRSFLADTSQDKRSDVIDRMLHSRDYADHFALKWCDILRIKRRNQKDRMPGTTAFHRWVRNAIATNKPYDQFAREILTATGNVSVAPTAQWYAEVRYLDRYVDDTAQVFLGIRIGCARCHDHPFEPITQGDYYGLAAFFSRVSRKGGTGVAERRANETVFIKATGEVKHPLTGEVVLPRGLGGPPLNVPPYHDPRHRLADWMAESDNPYFAKAFVNRMWAHFFGRGLVDPIDDIRATNPASNEALLEYLADEFRRSRFDMRHIVRLICTSSTYQLSASKEALLEDSTHHSRFLPQRLKAEVLLDAIDRATDVPTTYGGLPTGTRARQLPDEGYSNEFLRLFGRPPRESACECERTVSPSLSQSLFAMNSSFILGKTTSTKGLATRLAKDKRPLEQRIDDLFLTVFCRQPTDKEKSDALSYFREEKGDPRRAWSYLLWALINTKEFLFVH